MIAKLKTNDLVADENGRVGRVVSFGRDTVRIAWDSGVWDGVVQPYTDAELKLRGVVLVKGAR